MIAGGALGNLIDRVVPGAVTDMIRLNSSISLYSTWLTAL